jgi:LPPG:FO 2-phospho-L-lactate transferase
MKGKVLALCGGVGGAKLAYGLSKIVPPKDIVFLVNTGDDFIHFDLNISPDLDTVMYTLAELNDPKKGWGLRDETWNNLESLKEYGVDTWFQLGDKDLATHIRRTQLLKDGMKLSDITRSLSQSLGVQHIILPMSENPVQTIVKTDQGELCFQEYFVKYQCEPKVEQIKYVGNETAETPIYLKELINKNKLSGVIICPSNPYLSVDPILSIKEIKTFLLETDIPILAVSPIIDNDSIKGPTSKIMREMDIDPSVESIAQHYSGLIDVLVIDHKDTNCQPITDSMTYVADSIYMSNSEEKISLANNCIEQIKKLA